MKRIRFTEEQIVGVLRGAEAGAKTADLAGKHGVSEATLYNWKASMAVWKRRRRSACERWRTRTDASSGLWRMRCWTAQAEGPAFKKKLTPAAKREAVAQIQALLDVSERRACRVIAADRTVIRYQSRRGDDGELVRSWAIWRMSDDGSAITGCTSCCGATEC